MPVQCSGKMRRTGMRPSLPCSGPSKSMSRSTFLKKGSTSFQPQPRAPRAAHSSKSAGAPRLASWPLMEEPPPRMRACSYLRSGGRSSCGLLCETTSVRTLSSVQWKRGSK